MNSCKQIQFSIYELINSKIHDNEKYILFFMQGSKFHIIHSHMSKLAFAWNVINEVFEL